MKKFLCENSHILKMTQQKSVLQPDKILSHLANLNKISAALIQIEEFCW